MLSEIINALSARLKEKGIAPNGVEISPQTGLPVRFPALFVAPTALRFERKTMAGNMKCTVTIDAGLYIRDLKSEKARVTASSSIVVGILDAVSSQNLGLSITPIQPISATNASSAEDFAEGVTVWHLQFSTAFDHEPDDGSGLEEALETIGASYYLDEVDTTVEAAEVITLNE